ncbi:MAG: autotransporter domain-containing protein [Chthoniobacter sp.]|uniref:autotransporter family protein n=1 Tax=Chthoniobacter sp. TaxID=2510640 RepID=UPI0032A2F606
MKLPRRSIAILATGIAALCAGFGSSAHAVDRTWISVDPYPVWSAGSSFQQNWSGFVTPTGSDNAIFPSPIPPSSNPSFVGANPNGSEILLVDSGQGGPIAANLVFNDNYTLTSIPGDTIPGFFYPYAPLTLTQGGVTVNGDAIATIDSVINLPGGTLTKQGTGDLILFQTVKGNVVVQNGGLGGDFTVTGNLTNNAFLAGGKLISGHTAALLVAPGTIKVGGDFKQGKKGTLFVPISSESSYSQLVIKGKASLDGTASAVFLGGYTPKTGAKFTIIKADGGVSGAFAEVNSPFGGPILSADYSNRNTVVLTSGGVFGTAPNGISYSPNQQSVANALDAVAGDPRYAKVFNFIAVDGVQNLTHNLDRVAPEESAVMQSAGASTAQVHSNNVQGRTTVIRAGIANPLVGSTGGFSAQGLAINGDNPSYTGAINFRTGAAGPRGDDGKESKDVKDVAPPEDRWGAFLSGTGEWVNVSGTENARGYALSSGGFTLGLDYKLTPNFAIGVMAGYTGAGIDLEDNGRTWVNGGKLGIYATTFVGGWYADAAVTGGYTSYDNRRSALGGDARSDTDGGDLNVLIGTGYDIKAGALTFGPTASFNYTYTGVNGYTEHGSLVPLQVNGSHTESERLSLGFKASYEWHAGSVIVRPELRAAWQHEFGDVSSTVASSFAAGGGGTFDSVGTEIGRDSLLLGAGFAVQCSNRCTTFLYYDGELGRSHYISNAVTGGIRITF